MRSFKDNAGRTWTLAVHIDSIKRVRGLLQLDLLTVVDGSLLKTLTEDPVYLCDVIFALVKPEAEAQGVSDEEFGRAMAGDAIEHATNALLEELVGFFHGPKRRVLEKALRKLQTLEETATRMAEETIDGVNVEQVLASVPGAAGG